MSTVPITSAKKKKQQQPKPDDSCTDARNGGRLADAYGHVLRFIADQQSWLIWDGRRWKNATPGDLSGPQKINRYDVIRGSFHLDRTLASGLSFGRSSRCSFNASRP